jgi:hypothetical protein
MVFASFVKRSNLWRHRERRRLAAEILAVTPGQ